MTKEKYSLEIYFSKKQKMKIFLVDEEGDSQILHLKKGIDEYIPCITFSMNKVIIGEEKENAIHYMKDWIENPSEFKEYKISYKEKEYSVISEVLFALMINEIKKKVQRKVRLIQTRVYVPTSQRNSLLDDRMKIALDTIGLDGLEYNQNINYDYSNQGDIFNTILDAIEEYEKYKGFLHRAYSLAETEEQKRKLFIDNSKPITEELFNTICKRFTFKERSLLQLSQLDNYAIFIASRYLESIKDHKHLVRVSRRLSQNMEKFFYNPVSLTSKTRELFPNLKTLFVYSRFNNLFEEDTKIIARKIQFVPYYLQPNEKRQLEEWTKKSCKEVIFDSDVDNWSIKTDFDDKIMNKSNLVFIVKDSRDNVF